MSTINGLQQAFQRLDHSPNLVLGFESDGHALVENVIPDRPVRTRADLNADLVGDFDREAPVERHDRAVSTTFRNGRDILDDVPIVGQHIGLAGQPPRLHLVLRRFHADARLHRKRRAKLYEHGVARMDQGDPHILTVPARALRTLAAFQRLNGFTERQGYRPMLSTTPGSSRVVVRRKTVSSSGVMTPSRSYSTSTPPGLAVW